LIVIGCGVSIRPTYYITNSIVSEEYVPSILEAVISEVPYKMFRAFAILETSTFGDRFVLPSTVRGDPPTLRIKVPVRGAECSEVRVTEILFSLLAELTTLVVLE